MDAYLHVLVHSLPPLINNMIIETLPSFRFKDVRRISRTNSSSSATPSLVHGPKPIMHSIHFPFTITLLLLSICASAYFANEHPHEVIVATAVDSPADFLPARVALHSARVNGQLPDSTAFYLLTSPQLPNHTFASILQHDAMHHLTTSHPLVSLFKLPAAKILFISPHTLIVHPLNQVLRCPVFCATFHLPCSYSTSFLVLIPNAMHYISLQDRIDDKDICQTPPDWLSRDACILNDYIPLLQAPLLAIQPSTFKQPILQVPMRLPIGSNFPHHLFYPRMRWEIPPICGPKLSISFQTPSFLHPQYWWSPLIANPPRIWREIRSTLSAPFGLPSDAEICRSHAYRLVALITSLVVSTFAFARKNYRDAALTSPYFKPHKKPVFQALEPKMIPLFGTPPLLLTNVFSFVMAFKVTPSHLNALFAFPIFILYKTTAQTFLYALTGYFLRILFSGHTTIPMPHVLKTLAVCGLDSILVAAVCLAVWFIPAETMFDKIFYLLVAVLCCMASTFIAAGKIATIWVNRFTAIGKESIS